MGFSEVAGWLRPAFGINAAPGALFRDDTSNRSRRQRIHRAFPTRAFERTCRASAAARRRQGVPTGGSPPKLFARQIR
jgi:hypothetical protein